jgi:hypothetical protein
MFFSMSAYQDASLEFNQLNIKICDFFPLGAFGCFLTNVVQDPYNKTFFSPKIFFPTIHLFVTTLTSQNQNCCILIPEPLTI